MTRSAPGKIVSILDWLRSRLPRVWQAPRDPRTLGLRGEELACRELQRRGYSVVERRARSRLGEIDIVAWDGPVLVFVEVKTRRGAGYGKPAEAVDRRKQKKLATLAELYLMRKKLPGTLVRFDVVGVEILPGKRPSLEVLQGAFQDR